MFGASRLQEFGRRNVIHNTTKGGEAKRALINDKIGMIHSLDVLCANGND